MSGPSTNPEPYLKVLFHCFKHPSSCTTGLLVGKTWVDGSDDGVTKSHITDAIPISHSTPLTAGHPILQLALMQVHAVCASKGLTILGLYVANERRDDLQVSEHTKRCMKEIVESSHVSHSTEFVLWHLDNSAVQATCDQIAVRCHVAVPQASNIKHKLPSYIDPVPLKFAKWKGKSSSGADVASSTPAGKVEPVSGTDGILSSLRSAVQTFKFNELVDFEDHLENVHLDYFNENLPLSVEGGSPAEK